MQTFRTLGTREEAICQLRSLPPFPPEYAVISTGRQRLWHAVYTLYQRRALA